MSAYLIESEAQTYFEQNKLDYRAWLNTTSTQREKALLIATKQIDRLNYKGQKADEDQENEFPRGSDTEVPQPIKDACAELAYALLDGRDPEMEFDTTYVVSKKIGPVSTTSNPKANRAHIAAGIVSVTAWSLLLPFLENVRSIKVERV